MAGEMKEGWTETEGQEHLGVELPGPGLDFGGVGGQEEECRRLKPH